MAGRRRMVLRVALVAGAGIAFLLLILALVMHFTSPPQGIDPAVVPEKEVPAEWAEMQPPETAAGSDLWSSTGSLTLLAEGRPFGDETYRLDVSADGATLDSTGRFWFKIVVATVRVAFQQRWEGTADLRPTTYSLHVDAPLGQGQDIVGQLEAGQYVVRHNGTEVAVPVDPERTAVLGMFSTYALLPLLFAAREVDGIATFDALIFGGPPGTGKEAPGALPVIVVERAGAASVLIAGRSVVVDRLTIRSPYGDSTLYARGREFLALAAGTADRPLAVYRSDYFHDGFSVADAGE